MHQKSLHAAVWIHCTYSTQYIILHIPIPLLTLLLCVFCRALLCACHRGMMRANVDRLPGSYFLKRLTKHARNDLPFDHHDEKLQGPDGETQRYRHTTLMIEAMTVVHACTMSSTGRKRSLTMFKELKARQSKIPADIGPHKKTNPTGAWNSTKVTTSAVLKLMHGVHRRRHPQLLLQGVNQPRQ